MDLAVMLLDEYVRYPYGDTAFPLNPCAALKVLPTWAQPLLRLVC